ncbi:apiosidase-like domain-containing protein [Aminobacter sp. HY435]|uniref:apiosidase-like domain-containing protein n=1 Tax=Aminobacter sp. HY435 TaxID=2970917 RepID=UPI0022B991B6|nr:DUF4038 domain-containing protein [Aminobacter sp. HY435]
MAFTMRLRADRMWKSGWCLFLLAFLQVGGVFSANACGTEQSQAATFPLQVQGGERYLSDAAGQPFFLQGDAAWSLIAQLSREDAELYLRDRKARGFNTILVSLIEHRFADKAPANIFGDKPFLVDGDYGTPNEAYFRHADWVLQRACELGLVVLLAPSYAGHDGEEEGWYQEMVANGPEKLRNYGRFVGKRYARFDNILWVQNGDYNPPDKDLIRAIAAGIHETDPDALQTAHNAPETAALEYWPGEPWLNVDNVYTYGTVETAALERYENGGDLPFFLMESAYEDEHEADEQRVRMQAYQAVLSGASGQIFGNNPMWHFDGPGLYPAPTDWKQALDSPGARSMSLLAELVSSVKWWLLAPDTDGRFLVGGKGGDKARVAAAAAKDGSFGLVYLPTSKDVVLDLGRLSGPSIAARWLDPTTGQSVAVQGSPFLPATYSFRPARRNQGGFTDWVLVLTSQQASGQSQ